jgi:hypothetical protein
LEGTQQNTLRKKKEKYFKGGCKEEIADAKEAPTNFTLSPAI